LSPLTKVFVVFLVLSSLVLTSSVVVYVNREQNFKKKADDAQNESAIAKAAQLIAERDASAARQDKTTAEILARAQINDLVKDNKAKEVTISGLNVQNADQNSKIVQLQGENSRLADAVKASQETQGRIQTALDDSRKVLDEQTKRLSDSNAAISDLTNRLEATTREWRNFKEQLAEAQKQVNDLGKILKDKGIDVNTALAGGVGIKAGAPPINGVVKEVRPIEGVPYATISVGSADSVTRGMRFKIIDREKGDFLGFLTVEAVESNEASGKLEGPKIPDVKPGVEVRTQL
jgi:hypothetical protein